MLKLQLQYFGHLMQRTDSLEKILILGKIEGRRRRGWQRARWLDGIINSIDISLSKLQEMVKDREAWHAAVHGGHKESGTEQLLSIQSSDWTTPRDYPNPGIEPVSPSSPALAGRFFTTGPRRKPLILSHLSPKPATLRDFLNPIPHTELPESLF